jgi:hypothetical protein
MQARKKPGKRRPSSKKQSAFIRKSRFVLPWPYVVFIFLCIGVLLVGWTFQAEADNITVKAKVSAPLPNGPAVITSPGDGTHFSGVPITVAGTCPTDTYVELYRNDFFSGTALCTTDGNFQLQTDLFPGANQLKARVFNLTDDEGPQPTIITVYYDVPEPPAPGTGGNSSGSSGSSGSSAAAPFELSTDFAYKGYKVGQNIQWTINVNGGTPPYALNVDWGDGHNNVISQKEAGKVTLEHRYKSAGSHTKSSFIIKIMGTDSAGHKTFLQLFLSVGPSGIPSIVASNLPKGPHINKNWLLIAWPAYLVLGLMAASFWLGEREEIIKIKRSNFRGRRV